MISGIFDVKRFNAPKLSTFNSPHEIKTSLRLSEVTPLEVIPVYEHDEFDLSYTCQAKFKPLVAPAFQRIALKQWSHYVRNQDLWDDFNEFFTGVNPKLGQTAYTANNRTLVHPYLYANKSNQLGTSYLGAKPALSNVNMSEVVLKRNPETDYGYQLYIPNYVLEECLEQLKLLGQKAFVVNYEDGSIIKSIVSSRPTLHEDEIGTPVTTRLTPVLNVDPADTSLAMYLQVGNSVNDPQTITPANTLDFDELFQYSSFRGFKALFDPSTLCDYLGYPSADFPTYFNSPKFKEDIIKNFGSLTQEELFGLSDTFDLVFALAFIHKYLFRFNDNLDVNSGAMSSMSAFFGYPIPRGIDDNFEVGFSFDSYMNVLGYDTSSNQNIPLVDIVARYIAWMYQNNVNTTLVDDCPYFDFCPISALVKCSDEPLDSLRVRGYHKIINDYFRDVNLTGEIPVPYRDGGNDVGNYFTAVSTFLDNSLSTDGILRDWFRRDLLKDKKFSPYLDTDLNLDFIVSNDAMRNYVYSLATWDLLSRPFKHLRNRDYLTGLMPNSSVVDVVAPVMSPTQVQQAYTNSNQTAYTNSSIGVDSNNQLVHDNTTIDPYKATTDVGATPSAIGWLDIENLRITQKLKNYFIKLRYALNGIKDFSKVFFDIDVSDLEVGRSEFLTGTLTPVSISEIMSQSSTDRAVLGSLGGRANAYGSSDRIHKFVKYTGFLFTNICLSPLQTNIGGVNRQLIRKDRFDYFLPDFAELGDMKVTKIEADAMPTYLSLSAQYSDVLGYAPRYMDLKYVSSHVHADFLGSKSDWHLDILQSPISSNDVELSQQWLEERADDDRIFTDLYDKECVCDVWVHVDCVYQRALPAVSHADIIA